MSKAVAIAEILSTGQTVSSGTIVPFAMETAPDGWLVCDGSALSRTTYASLFTAIGTTWGVGDGSTTFNLPDLRGEFLRGFDGERGVDDGRLFGSFQTESIGPHTHPLDNQANAYGSGTPYFSSTSRSTVQGRQTGVNSGTENRPRNIAVQYCIKY